MDDPIESVSSEVRRIDATGTVWFASSTLSAAVVLAGIMAAGWNPADLALPASIAWWVGAVAVLLGIAGFGWAGCPVLGFPVEQADRQKSLCIRTGVVLYTAGGVIVALSTLLG